ncbi:MAG: hypothetical protein QOG04_1820 [Actinomycetota bacterium]|jgi:hypothetical protein|nr:hypothetical protein [Actinomycetota bacterium]
MAIDFDAALQRALSEGDLWQSWRAMRLEGKDVGDPPAIPAQDQEGAFVGPGGRPSPGATGEGLCHLKLIGLSDSGAAAIAVDWLEEARTPAEAWLDSPDEVPGELDNAAAARVWATAAAACGLLVSGRDPGSRALDLLRGESDQLGRFTGGGYPTFAAAAAYWLAQGPKTEIAEWALRWAREEGEDWWGPWERATALTFWLAAGIPPEHASVEIFLDELRDEAEPSGWADDLGLTIRTLELLAASDR